MRAIYYDTETTGVRPDKDRIIEFAAYDPVNDKSFERFVNPGCPISQQSVDITGITDEMVKDADSFGKVGEAFLEFCSGDVVLIAHNNDSFDKPFLENEFARAGVEFPKFKYIDTLKWARKYRPDLPRHALQYLREVYGVEENNAHRALEDVKVMIQIFTQMIGDLPIDTVYTLMQQKGQPLRQMPFGKHKGIPLEKVPKHYLTWLSGSGALDKPGNEELKEALAGIGITG